MTLHDMLDDALASTTTDEELALALVRSPILATALRLATMTEDQVREQLDYGKNTLRVMQNKSEHFPVPLDLGKRWVRPEILDYQQHHPRRGGQRHHNTPTAPPAPPSTPAPPATP